MVSIGRLVASSGTGGQERGSEGACHYTPQTAGHELRLCALLVLGMTSALSTRESNQLAVLGGGAEYPKRAKNSKTGSSQLICHTLHRSMLGANCIGPGETIGELNA